MEIKFILIIGLIILITMYFINEFKIMKNSITETNENVIKLLKTKFHTLTNELKEFNNDLVNQTKKINKIHSQKITNMSNYFTDSDSNNKNIINYLSDSKNDEMFKINFDKDENKCSEIKQTNDNDIISNTSDEHIDEIKKNIMDELSPDSSKSSKSSEVRPINDENNNDSKSNKDNKSDTNKSFKNESNNNNTDNKSVATKSDNRIEFEKEIKSNESKSIKQSESESSGIKNQNDTNKGEYTEQLTEKEDDNESDKISIESLQVKSLHDMISFGSKKSKGKKIKLDIGNDERSLDSNDIKNMKTLNNIESYTKKNLDNIAKLLNISIFYKDGTKRISYKKEELYLKIKEILENK
jgi:hypothetical protein